MRWLAGGSGRVDIDGTSIQIPKGNGQTSYGISTVRTQCRLKLHRGCSSMVVCSLRTELMQLPVGDGWFIRKYARLQVNGDPSLLG